MNTFNLFLQELLNNYEISESNHDFVFAEQSVNVRFRFAPYSIVVDGLPVISHFEFKCNGVLADAFDFKYYSHFFHPILLNDYNNLDDAIKDCFKHILKEKGILESDILKESKKQQQLSLF